LTPPPKTEYIIVIVKEPLINLDEKIDRFVGRRGIKDSLSTANSRKVDAIAWREKFGALGVPKGVYRFNSHEEADEWLWRMITRPRPT